MSEGWKWPPGWRALRRATFARYGHVCWRCGAYAGTVDHVIPVVLGGTHDLSNLRPCCSFHNSSTGAAVGNRLRPRRPLTTAQRRAIAAKQLPGRQSRDW
jgi:5-methylcytosine-specific restriction endonuclease McrA